MVLIDYYHFPYKFIGVKIYPNDIWKIIIGTILVLGVILAGLAIAGTNTIDDKTSALGYHKISREFDDEVYHEGYYIMMSGDVEMFKYPNKFVTLNVDHNCFSKDGLVISVKPTYQYNIDDKKLFDIVSTLGKANNVKNYINDMATTSTMSACSNFTASDFFGNRENIGKTMDLLFKEMLSSSRLANSIPGFTQLTNYDVPSKLKNAINEVQSAVEDVQTATNEREGLLTIEYTEQLKAKEQNKILLVNANSTARSTIFDGQQKAEARISLWDALAKTYHSDINNIGLTPDEYVTGVLTPKIDQSALDDKTKSCLSNCEKKGGACWYCWTSSNVNVNV